MTADACACEFEFTLVLTGVTELTDGDVDALFAAGCDDATPSARYGRVYLEFARTAASLEDAIVSAVRDVRRAGIGADVLRVAECDLVTQADIARRIDRPRQVVHQYIHGQRGPGGFPGPVCWVADEAPLWGWCEVSHWLAQNSLVDPRAVHEAAVVEAVNAALAFARQQASNPALVNQVVQLAGSPAPVEVGGSAQP